MNSEKIQLRAVAQFEDGVSKGVDFSEPNSASPLPVRNRQLTLARIPRPPVGHSLLRLAYHPPLKQRNAERAGKMKKLQRQTYSVLSATGSFFRNTNDGVLEDRDRIEIHVPFGSPQFVNARTLKAMLGASSGGVLLRKVGERWEVCPDSFLIDLRDRRQVFKLGRVQIFS